MEVPSPLEPLELRPVDDLGSGPPQPPSPLSGCYLLIVIGEPHSEDHKEIILQRIAKGFLSWDSLISQVDLEKELLALTAQAPEGEEARNGERLIQYATENLVTEVLIHPQVNTLVQCVRNLLSSFTRHRHLIHAGYTFAGNGSWILQDGTFSLADFTDAFQEVEVQRVLRAYENSVTVDVHCSPDGDWTTERLAKEPFSRSCKVRVNPDDTLTAGGTPIGNFIDYISPFLKPAAIEDLLEPSDVVGNIRFSHPTLYVFPGGQGDAALFGINGFNMLVDGGFGRKSCFWDFARHLDRLDAVLMTRINNGNISGVASLMRRKKQSHVYPQIGHFFCNLQDRRTPVSPDGDKERDPLLVGLGDEGQDIVLNLRHIQLRPHCCYREGNVVEPVNLYHKVGHGKLDMYIISPTKDSREVKDFLARWNASDARLFAGSKKDSKDFHFPLQNLVSICALLVWQPANPNDTITRILFPGSTPQHKIFEGLEKLKHLEFLKHPVCSMKSITPSGSTVGISSKVGNKVRTSATVLDKLMPAEKENMREASQKAASMESNKQTKSATIPVASDVKATKVSSLSSTPITKALPPLKHKVEKPPSKPEPLKRTEANKSQDGDKPKKPAEKKIESKPKIEAKVSAAKPRPDVKPTRVVERKVQKTTVATVEKKTSEKASPTTPKKTVAGVASKIDAARTARSTSRGRPSPTATPAKSAKDANNRKVVESKANVTRVSTTASRPPAKAPLPKKEDAAKPERKPIARKPRTSASPIKRGPGSPAKTAAAKPAPKTEKESAIRKIKSDVDKQAVDSSEVSTPSTAEAAEATLLKALETVAKSSALLNGEPTAAVEETAGDVEAEPQEKAVAVEGKVDETAEAASDDGDKEVEEEAVEDKAAVVESEVAETADDDKADDEAVQRQESAEVQDEDVTEGNDAEDDAPIEKGDSLQAELAQEDKRAAEDDDDEGMECDDGEEAEEEEEYLIIEREEREEVDESLQDQESGESRAQEAEEAEEAEDDGELKKQRDEVESEKEKNKSGDDDVNGLKDDVEEVIDDKQGDAADHVLESIDAKEIDLDEAIDAKEDGLQQNKHESELDTTDDIDKLETLETKDSKDETNDEIDLLNEKLITKESKEQIEEEVKEIILSAEETVSKKQSISEAKPEDDEKDEGSDKKKSEEGEEAKELSSISPEEKLDNSSEKNREVTDDNREVTEDDRDTDQRIQDQEHDEYEIKRAAARDVAASADQKYPAEESQPDEKFSATAESAATTAPTLPEDERIPLDEIKEIVEEKHTKEDTKEKEAPLVDDAPRHEQPTTLPQVVIPGGVPSFPPHGLVHHRDIVKTPDEVADLPMHEEVDPGMYESNEFDRDFNKIKDQDSGTGSSKKQDSDELRRQSPELEITGELQLKDEEKPSQQEDGIEEAVEAKGVKDVESGAENQNAKDEEVKPDDGREIVGSLETVESGVKGDVDEEDAQQAKDASPEEGAKHDVMDDGKEAPEEIKVSATKEETQIETKQGEALISKKDEKLNEVKDSHEDFEAPVKETDEKAGDEKTGADAKEEDTKDETKLSEQRENVGLDVVKHDDIKQLTMSFIETEQSGGAHVDPVEAARDSASPVTDVADAHDAAYTDLDKPGSKEAGGKTAEDAAKETKVDDVFEQVKKDLKTGEADELADNEKNEKICHDVAVDKELEDVKGDLKEGDTCQVDGESLQPDDKFALTAISNEDLVANSTPRSKFSGVGGEVVDKDAPGDAVEDSEVKMEVERAQDISKPSASPEPIRESISPVPNIEVAEKVEVTKVETISKSPSPEPTKQEHDQEYVKDDEVPNISQSLSPAHKGDAAAAKEDSKSPSPEPIRQSLSPEPTRDAHSPDLLKPSASPEPKTSEDRTRSPSPDNREGSASPSQKPSASPDLKIETDDKSRSTGPNAKEVSVSSGLKSSASPDLKMSEDRTRSPSPDAKEGPTSPALKPSANSDLKVETEDKSRSASPDVREGSISPALKPSASPDLKLDAEEREHGKEERVSKPSSPDLKQGSEGSVPQTSASPDLQEKVAEKDGCENEEQVSKSPSPVSKDVTDYPDRKTSITDEKESDFIADAISKSPTPDAKQGSLSPLPPRDAVSPDIKASLSPEPTDAEQKDGSKAASPCPSPDIKASLSPQPTDAEQKDGSKAASPCPSPDIKASLSPQPTDAEQKDGSKAASPCPSPDIKASLSPEPTNAEQKDGSKAASPCPSPDIKASLSPEPTDAEQKDGSKAASPCPSPDIKASLSPEPTDAEQKDGSKAASPCPSPDIKASLSPEPTDAEQKDGSKAASPCPSPDIRASLSPEPTEAEQKEGSKAASPCPSPDIRASLSPEPTEAEQKEGSKAASPCPSPDLKLEPASPAIPEAAEINGVSDEKRDYSKEETISKSSSPDLRETASPDPKTSASPALRGEPEENKNEAKQDAISKTASPDHKPSTVEDEVEVFEKHDSPKKEVAVEVDANKASEQAPVKENGERADSGAEKEAVYGNLDVPGHPEVITMSPDSTPSSPRSQSKESSKESEMKKEVKEIDDVASKAEADDDSKEKVQEPTHKENKEVEEEMKKEINNDVAMQELPRDDEGQDEKKDKEKEGPVEAIKSAVSSVASAIGDFGKGLLDHVSDEGKASADEGKSGASLEAASQKVIEELITEKSDAEENLDLISKSAKNVKEVVTNEASMLDDIVDSTEDAVSSAFAKISSETEKAMDALASDEEIDENAAAGFSAEKLPSFEGMKIHENLSGILSHTLDEKSLEEVKSYIDNVETHLDDAKSKLEGVKLHHDDEKSTLLKQPIVSDLTRKESSGAIAFQLDNGSFDDDEKAISSSESDDGSKPKLVEFLVGDEKIVISDAEKKQIADDAAKADQVKADKVTIDEQQVSADVTGVAKADERPITPATSITSTIATDDADSSHLKPAPGREQDISQSASDNDESVIGDDVTTVKRMLVTASSEDGGAETEVCPSGSITFTTSLSSKPSCEDLTSMLPDIEPLDLDDEDRSDKVTGYGESASSKHTADDETEGRVKGNQGETGEKEVKGDAHAGKDQKERTAETSHQNGDSIEKSHATNGHLSSSHEDLNGHETFETKSIKNFSTTVEVSEDKKVAESQITSEATKTFEISGADKSEVLKELPSVGSVVSAEDLKGDPAICDLSKIPGDFSVDSSIDLLPSGVKKEIDQAKTSPTFGGDVDKLSDNVIVGEEKVHEVIIESRGMKEIVSFVEESGDSSANISGVISGIKKHDSFRSATPGSDDVDMGGPLSPMSDISSGQVSRVPDSRNYESDVDDDGPMTPSSVTSQHAHSPTQTHFRYELGDSHASPPIDIRHTSATLQYDPKHAMDHEHGALHKEPMSTLDSAMTSSFYGELSLDPLHQLLEEREEQEAGFLAGAHAIKDPMTSSFYASHDADDAAKYGGAAAFFHTESDEHSGDYEPESGEFDFERAVHEHRTARGGDMMSSPGKTYRYETKADTNGKASPSYLSKYDQHGLGEGGKHFAEAFGNGNVDERHFDDATVMNKEYKEKLNGKSDCKETTSTTMTKETDFSSTKTTTAIHDPLYRVDVDVDNASTAAKTQKPEAGKPDDKVDPIQGWGKPLGLPSPAPPPTENTSTNKGTPKKEKKPLLIKKSLDNKTGQKEVLSKKRSESPVKQADKKGLSNKDGVRAIKATGNPIYLDLTYVPHHGNSYYSNVEFFKKVRARYYVFSGTEPSREVYNALLEAKQAWDDKELEVTIIPTYDTDILGYWVAENEDILAKHKIDLSPSASRCTINLQDHETSCSAYRLEF